MPNVWSFIAEDRHWHWTTNKVMMVSATESEMWWKWNKSTTTDKTSRQMISQSPLLWCCKSNSLKWKEKLLKKFKKALKRHHGLIEFLDISCFAIIKLVFSVLTFECLWPRVPCPGDHLLVCLGPWSKDCHHDYHFFLFSSQLSSPCLFNIGVRAVSVPLLCLWEQPDNVCN